MLSLNGFKYFYLLIQITCIQQFQIIIIFPGKRLNSSIWPTDRTLKGTTTPGHSGPGSNGTEGEVHISKFPGLEPHHQMQFNDIPRTLISFKYCYLTPITYSTLFIRLDIIIFLILIICLSIGMVKFFGRSATSLGNKSTKSCIF